MALIDRWNHFLSKRLPLRARFRRIYQAGGFGGTSESVSGVGSSLDTTANVRGFLAQLVRELEVGSVLDAPCGDFHWMQEVELGSTSYFGVDIVPELVRENARRFGGPRRNFSGADLRSGPLPSADLVICRDCLVHLSARDALSVLRNLLRTGASWFLLTSFPGLDRNQDLVSGMGWRPLNLERPPFSLTPPYRSVVEAETDTSGNPKTLGLWRRSDLCRALDVAG